MTTGMRFAVFENFNDPGEAPEPPEPVLQETLLPADEVAVIREEAWTDGFLAGRQARDGEGRPMAAKLLTSLHDMEGTLAETVEAASIQVAGLLVNTVLAVAEETWSAGLLDRVQLVANRIKPALSVAPSFALRDQSGTIRHFPDLLALSQAIEIDGGDDVTISWQRGEATISRTSLLDDLRQALVPLAAHAETPDIRHSS